MSDPMMGRGMGMPPGGPQGGPQRPPSPVEKNLSVLNPQDAQLQMASGQITPDMTVRDFLAQQGVDVDGPISQLAGFLDRQQQNANPINKMRNIAADTALQKGGSPMPAGKPGAAPGPQAAQPAPGGLQGLMGRLGGR